MSQVSPIILFSLGRFQQLPWKLYHFAVTASSGRKTFTRKISVFSPIKEAAKFGTGAQMDENIRELQLNDVESFLRRTGQPKKPKAMEVVTFLLAMSQNLRAGVSVTDALKRCSTNAKTPYFRGVLGCMAYYTSTLGGDLSTVMALFPECFNEVVVARIEAGETAGKLQPAFESLGQSEKEDYKLKRKLAGMMLYPAILGVAIFGLFMLVQFFVLPRMSTLFEAMSHSGLPLSTRIVMGTANFVKTHWYFLIIPITAGYYLIENRHHIFASDAWQRFVLQVPGVGPVVRHMVVIRSLRVLSTLLSSGAPVVKTFEIVARVSGNVVYATYFDAIFQHMKAGDAIDKAFFAERHRIGEIGLDIAQQMQISAGTGDPRDALGTLVEIQQTDMQTKLDTLPILLNAFMLFSIAPFFILLALAIIEPSLAMAQDATRATVNR